MINITNINYNFLSNATFNHVRTPLRYNIRTEIQVNMGVLVVFCHNASTFYTSNGLVNRAKIYTNSSRFYSTSTSSPLENSLNINTQIERKAKFIDIPLSPNHFYNLDIFIYKLQTELDLSLIYSLLFRVCYGGDRNYKMLGNQYGLYFANFSNNRKVFEELHNAISSRLYVSKLNYSYTGDDKISIQIIAYKV
jgi:hypothetical protein